MQYPEWADKLKSRMGLDRAIIYAVSGRAWSILGNLGVVLLIVRFLGPIEQGYYFTLTSLLAIQVVFELGFAFVVQQFAAHECASLELSQDGNIKGDHVPHARLASILQLALRWYSYAAVLMGAVLLPVGIYFFSSHTRPGVHVPWHLPWIMTVSACLLLFVQDPVFSFLQGCGQIRQVAGLRLSQSVAGTIATWGALVTHHGLFAPSMAMFAGALVGSIFVFQRRNLLIGLLRFPATAHAVSWRNEIWPFQWKIAASWLCTYFTMQVFTPILFAYRSPVEAGQMGMSLSVIGYVSAIVLAWMTTKAPLFGQLIARNQYGELDKLFFSTLRQSLSLLVAILAVCMAGVIGMQQVFPKLAIRFVNPLAFGLMLLTVVSSVIVQSQAIYLRSFKREPFLLQSVVIACLTLTFCLATARAWGNTGMALSYFFCTGIIGLISGTRIFHSWRRNSSSFRPVVAPPVMEIKW